MHRLHLAAGQTEAGLRMFLQCGAIWLICQRLRTRMTIPGKMNVPIQSDGHLRLRRIYRGRDEKSVSARSGVALREASVPV